MRIRATAGRLAPRTLAGRLALGGIAWIGAWAVALLLAFNVLLANVLAAQVDDALRARAQAVAATVQFDDGELNSVGEGNDEALDAGTSIYLGAELVEGAPLSAELRQDLLQVGEITQDSERYGPVRHLAYPITENGRQIGTIVVSSDIGLRNRTVQLIAVTSLAFIVLTLVFTFFALRATIVRALNPVRAMGEQAASWSEHDLEQRFDPGSGPLELRELSTTLNGLLERIAAALRHERNFTAELSHELRTPLAHLHAEVDLLSPHEPLGAEAVEHLLTSIRRLEGLVETALVPARIVRDAAVGLGRVGDALEGLRAPAASAARLVVDGDLDIVLAVESDIARRALNPLLENAFRYAVQEVRIEITGGGGRAMIAVSDDGGGLDPLDAERVFAPGFRADPADGHPGAGLGLALTRRICRSAGGDVRAHVIDGRTVFTLTLPSLGTVRKSSGSPP
ncbi:ATP-binding protein [Kineosporia succinea]|uniref:histidine kinase n=1 Tax=Kineosporia succinea TaxID=84632 RepID=A0ABT9PD82_9ACTN|nr:ATP-binding protein [Kineosporia succinea]MDP9830354.1 signal transduction histidine kinase [Kineosporia succinea]